LEEKVNKVTLIEDKFLKEQIVSDILETLPEWFGIPSATKQYIEDAKELPLLAYKEEEDYLGFISLKEQSEINLELYVLGVLKNHHNQGIGKALFIASKKYAKDSGYKYITVKTLDESNDDLSYQKTRNFYYAIGFKKFEVFPSLWGLENPCLLMILDLEGE